MTRAEVRLHPGPDVELTHLTYGADALTVTDDRAEEKLYSAAELLEVVLAAYERGFTEAGIRAQRERWNSHNVHTTLRRARHEMEASDMKRRAVEAYERRGLPAGYDYRGGAVDWDTGMPDGSACAWLRRRRTYELAGGSR